jgi:hypothetical protein
MMDKDRKTNISNNHISINQIRIFDTTLRDGENTWVSK